MGSFIGEVKREKVTGDGQQLEVHRLILSASSPVLRSMFGRKSNQNTLLFLRCVDSKSLAAIMDFMYLGEMKILEKDLSEFMSVAKDFVSSL